MFIIVTYVLASAQRLNQIQSVVAGSGQTVEIVNSSNFCFFLPPPGSSDMNISDNEGDAVAYCKGSTPKASDSNTFPSGFILSAHVVTTSDYIQVTGQIDPTKAGLNANDDGGQYDIMAPKGATCAGYDYFVNLVEPSGNDYCIRCCNTETNCNRDGCARVVPGDYSGPGVDSSSDSGSSSSSSAQETTTTEAAAATTTTSDSSDSTTTADDSTTTTSSVDVAASPVVTSSVPASSSVVPSTSVALVSASSSSIGIATTNLPTESIDNPKRH
ncbi:hypothetical protein BC943DRAFT_342517 [Umbelopsis sp. AD052]|nr:hypothetical protein BC943DRAFT_342517 [Umbelopsis sp. AD052]